MYSREKMKKRVKEYLDDVCVLMGCVYGYCMRDMDLGPRPSTAVEGSSLTGVGGLERRGGI